MSIIIRMMRNDDSLHASGIISQGACQRAAADHFYSVLYRKRRNRQKAICRLTLDTYMLLSGRSVNPDRRLHSGLRRAVGQISQQVSSAGIGIPDLKRPPRSVIRVTRGRNDHAPIAAKRGILAIRG